MKYKIETLLINDRIVDIPNGCIPINYGDSIIVYRESIPLSVKKVVILRPINELEEMAIEEEKEKKKEKGGEDLREYNCFFCDINQTKEKIGIIPICSNCLAQLYGMVKESHKSYEC